MSCGTDAPCSRPSSWPSGPATTTVRDGHAGTDGAGPSPDGPAIGLTVRDLDGDARQRYRLPRALQGVVMWRVEPMSPAFDAEIERGAVILEINRRPVTSAAEYSRH